MVTFVHSGDFTFGGSEKEAYDFVNWLCDLPYKHKIFIAGNHDLCMYGADSIDGLPNNVHYLCNSSVVIDGMKFYGMPMFMEDCMDGTYDKEIAAIPNDTDVLITHQPPYGILDGGEYKGVEHYHYGDTLVYNRCMEVKPGLHLFGHDHNDYGHVTINGTVFSNAAVVDEHYELKNFEPQIYTI